MFTYLLTSENDGSDDVAMTVTGRSNISGGGGGGGGGGYVRLDQSSARQ